MIMSYKNISSNTINRHRTGGIIMTELSRFQKDVEVAASALEMRAENEDAREEAIHLYRKFGSTKQEPLRLAVALRGYFLEEGVEEEERAHYGAYLKKRIRPAVERLILEDDWEKIGKLYENEWFGEQELEVFLKLAEEWRRPAALMGLLHLKKEKYGFNYGFKANKNNLRVVTIEIPIDDQTGEFDIQTQNHIVHSFFEIQNVRNILIEKKKFR